MEAIYPMNELKAAYQLNWSLSVFTRVPLPDRTFWYEPLMNVTEQDGVRILEYRSKADTTHQFFVSTLPGVEPCGIARSVKGRLQYLLRDTERQLFQRNYYLQSVGAANYETLERYVSRQIMRHPMVDDRVQRMLEGLQYHDPMMDLSQVQSSKFARYIVNYHLVFESCEHLPEIREDRLMRTQRMIIRAAKKHRQRLSQIGLVSNHFHMLLGCGLQDDPLTVAASYLNNIAFAHGMKRILEPSFYAGTFGPYDRAAIRRHLAAG